MGRNQRSADFNDTNFEITVDGLKIQIEMLNRSIWANNCQRHMHGNDFYELHFISSGKGALLLDSEKYDLASDSLYMTGPHVPHTQLIDPDDPLEKYCIGMRVIQINPDKITDLSHSFIKTHFWIGMDKSEKCRRLFSQIEEEHIEKRIGYVNNIKNYISEIFVQLVRLYTNSAKAPPSPALTTDIRRMFLIDGHFLEFFDTLTEDRLAAALGLSVRQVQRFLKEQYGKTFSQMKRAAKANKAKELLNHGYSLEKIAELVGYKSAKSVSDALKSTDL
ncbi:MAG: AraC family transcriptional regulator [Clostridia bacterium]|nr:AraC family transcriptional regulator [Clostridia bacterium]